MGYSVRTGAWRLTIWARWNSTTLCPDWAHRSNALELYDHRQDNAPLDLDGTTVIRGKGNRRLLFVEWAAFLALSASFATHPRPVPWPGLAWGREGGGCSVTSNGG